MLLEQFLERSAERLPAKTALVFGNRRLSYQELDEAANTLANSLIESGIERGDRIAVYLDNSVETIVGIFAILKAGAAFVLLNASTKAEKVAYVLNHCRASAVITDAKKLQAGFGVWTGSSSLGGIWIAGRGSVPMDENLRVYSIDGVLSDPNGLKTRPPKRVIDQDMAALIYTSGSTGRPKGVIATHLSLTSAACSIETYLENRESDVILNVLPLSFSYGLFQVLVTFKTGGTLILERSFTYHYAVLDTMTREGVTGFALVPTIAAILLQLNLERYPLPSLRYVTNAAAALSVHHIAKLRALWPHTKLYSMYGQTECVRISYLPPEELDIRPGSIGRGIPNQELWLVDEHGERVPPGQVGELVVRGTHVARGYWEDEAATGRSFRPGLLPSEKVLYTGDLFRMDEEGFLYFVSRQDDIIKTRGEKVSPKEVEEVLYGIDGVSEAVVLGVPDDVLGQSVRAVLCLRDGVTPNEQEVLRHCARLLEDFMVPKSVVFLPELPKNSNGKIDRRELNDKHGGPLLKVPASR